MKNILTKIKSDTKKWNENVTDNEINRIRLQLLNLIIELYRFRTNIVVMASVMNVIDLVLSNMAVKMTEKEISAVKKYVRKAKKLVPELCEVVENDGETGLCNYDVCNLQEYIEGAHFTEKMWFLMVLRVYLLQKSAEKELNKQIKDQLDCVMEQLNIVISFSKYSVKGIGTVVKEFIIFLKKNEK